MEIRRDAQEVKAAPRPPSTPKRKITITRLNGSGGVAIQMNN